MTLLNHISGACGSAEFPHNFGFSLQNGIREGLALADYLLVSMGSNCIAVSKTIHSYVLFDPHARDCNGRLS